MNVTRIRLIGDFFNIGINDYLEVAESVVVPLNFGVSDVRDFTSKTGSFSKSIKIAGTKHNNLVFDHIFDVNNVTLEFNINTKQQCLIEQDGEIVLDNAIMQLIDVQKFSTGMGYDEQIEYTITVKDTVSELFTDIGNKLLTDLDFSDLNHTYQASDVIASYDHDKEDGYKYILPIADDSQYDLTEMKPAVYVWQYLNRIFSNAGYSYQFNEMAQIGIDKLLIPYNGGKSKISTTVQDEVEVIAEETTPQSLNYSSIALFQNQKIQVTTEISDVNGYYNPITSIYTSPFNLTAPNQIEYKLSIDFSVIIDNQNFVTITPDFNAKYKPIFGLRKPSGNPFFPFQTLNQTYGYFDIVNPAFTIDNDSQVVIPNGYFLPVGQTFLGSGVNNITLTSPCQIGNLIELFTNIYSNSNPGYSDGSTPLTANFELVINSIEIRIVPSGESLTFQMPVVMNDFIPANIKQSDFLKSIFTMFNLFVIPNADNPKDIIIQTRDSYYDSGVVKDFTKELCKELPQMLTFLPELTAKKVTLSYSDDTDSLNVGYKKNVNETYGQTQYIFDNEYIKNEAVNKVIFGASPFITSPFGATVMAINGSEPKTLPRIVYDGGKLPCGYYQINDAPYQWISVNEYPYVGHFSAPVNPDKDFNFGTCDYYFENTYGVIPYNNLGNTYWRRTMAQINSGSLYSVYLKVNSFQVANLRLNDKIYLDRAYWIINKVIDYDANSNAPTKFELLSVDPEIKLPSFPLPKPNRPNKHDAGVSTPVKDILKKRYDSLTSDSSTGGVVLLGKGNQILGTVKNALIIGDNQIVSQDGIYTPKVFIGATENVIPTYTFKALVTQTGVTSPRMNVAVDQFGLTISRTGVGTYELTSSGLFLGQVICLAQFSHLTSGLISIGRINNNTVQIQTTDLLGTLTDALLTNTTIVIESWQTK